MIVGIEKNHFGLGSMRCKNHLVTDIKSSPLSRVEPLKYMVRLCFCCVCVCLFQFVLRPHFLDCDAIGVMASCNGCDSKFTWGLKSTFLALVETSTSLKQSSVLNCFLDCD